MDHSLNIDPLLSLLVPPVAGAPAPQAVVPGPDRWAALVHLARRHQLAPLLAHRLRDHHPELRLPSPVQARLRKAVHLGTAGSIKLLGELGALLGVLGDAGVPVIPLKGAHLASLVYHSPELRQMKDLDLLVPASRLALAVQTIERLGYGTPEPFSLEDCLARSLHLPVFLRPGSFPLELHWAIERPAGPFRVDLEGIWERSCPAMVADQETRVMAPEDLLLHLCLHAGYHHRFIVPLRVFCDIEAILHRFGPELDPAVLAERAAAWGAERPVHLCLSLAAQLMGAAVPEEMLRRLQPADFRPEIAAAAREQVEAYAEEGPFTPRLTRANARLWGVEWPWASPSFWLGRLVLPRRAPARNHTAGPGFSRTVLHYPRRALNLLIGTVRGGWRMLLGRRELSATARREQLLGTYITRQNK